MVKTAFAQNKKASARYFRGMSFFRYGGCLAALLLSVAPAFAERDGQIWSVINLSARLNDRVSVNLETQYRFIDDAASFGQRIIRPSATYRVNDVFSVTGGYAYVRTDPRQGASFEENRLWQQIGYRLFTNAYGLTVTGRSRIEQRFIEGDGETGLRFRQRFQAEAPIRKQHAVRLVFWNETFYGLNRTKRRQRDTLNRMRSFAGVSFPVFGALRAQAGYLNQFVNNQENDATHHVFASSLTFSF